VRRRRHPRRTKWRDRILFVVTTDPDGGALATLPDLSGKDVRLVAPLARLSVARQVSPDADRAVGADDILLAVEDELSVFDADEIWLVTSPTTEETWLEAGLHGSGLARFGRPVRRAATARDAS
jgi:hypothetical protein